jgi:hypothetical protein
MTATPAIQAGTTVGQELFLCGTDDTYTVSIPYTATEVSNGDGEIGKDDCIGWLWLGTDGVNSSWVRK